MYTKLQLSLWFLLATSAAATPVQEGVAAGPAEAAGTAESVSHGAGLMRVDGVARALGDGWKARLEPGRVVVTPALGPRAPRNLPVAVELTSILRGDEVVWTPARTDEPVLDGLTATYDRGGVLERYEARPEGLAQSFVLDAPFREPDALGVAAGNGDLVVRMKLATDLEVRGGGGAQPLRLGRGELRDFTIGAVTGIDANGARRAGELRLDVGGNGERVLDLALPADFVADAAWPLVVDPLFGPEETSVADANSHAWPDVAFDGVNDDYLIVWQTIYSAGDVDVEGRLRYTGSLYSPLIPIEPDDAQIDTLPQVAFVRDSGAFLVTWSRRTTIFGATDLFARCVSDDANVLGPSGAIVADFENELDVDLASVLSGDDVPMVYELNGNGIRYATVDARLSVAPSVVQTTTLSATSLDVSPDLSETVGPGGELAVAWQRLPLFSGSDDIVVRRFSTATGWSSATTIGSAAFDDSRPNIDGYGDEFVVAYLRESGSLLTTIFEPLSFDGAAFQTGGGFGIGTSGHHYAAATYTGYGSVVTGRSVGSVDARTVDALVGFAFSSNAFLAQAANPDPRHAASSRFHGTGEAAHDGLLVYEKLGWILARPLDDDTGITPIPAACGPSMGAARASTLARGETYAFELSGASALGVPVMIVGFQSSPASCGSCTVVPSISPNPVVVVGSSPVTGDYRFEAPVPDDPNLLGLTLYTQLLLVGTPHASCAGWPFETSDAFAQVVK